MEINGIWFRVMPSLQRPGWGYPQGRADLAGDSLNSNGLPATDSMEGSLETAQMKSRCWMSSSGSLTSIYIEDVHHFGSWMALEWLNIPLPERIPSELRFRAERVKPRGVLRSLEGLESLQRKEMEGTERTKVPIKDWLLEVIIGFAFLTETS